MVCENNKQEKFVETKTKKNKTALTKEKWSVKIINF
jgi:hypothetical protein